MRFFFCLLQFLLWVLLLDLLSVFSVSAVADVEVNPSEPFPVLGAAHFFLKGVFHVKHNNKITAYIIAFYLVLCVCFWFFLFIQIMH